MQILPVVIDNQIVGASIARQVFRFDSERVSNNHYVAVWSMDIDEPAANVQRLMNVAEEVNQQLHRVAFAERMIRIGMSLQRANTDVEQVNNVVVGSEAGARLVVFAVEREIV